MKNRLRFIALVLAVVLAFSSTLLANEFLEGLQQDQSVHGFRTANIYENGAGKALGARFVSEKYGFVVDLMQIQSVPQAFYWIKTPVTGSQGEPHACEHLLLGKGKRGRYVAALEDMALGNSTAYTQQYRTCYHFNTSAGEETFYDLFEAKLQAFLHPDFTDEEIRREVCHIGVTEDPQTGELSVEEKGTVYTEMVSAFEKPWYYTWGTMSKLTYGEDHPLAHCSGGQPDSMRNMVPEDMWAFHKENYHLANMGAIVSIPSQIDIETFLERTNTILGSCQDYADSSPNVGIGAYDFPDPKPAPLGTTQLVGFPSDKPEDPGDLMYTLPLTANIDFNEEFILDIFLSTFSSGETSDLYNTFINSATKKTDFGASSVYGGWDDDLGHQVYFGLSGVPNDKVTERNLDSAYAMIVSEMRRIRALPEGSEELREFNARAANRLASDRKFTENYLNQPPMFGFRRGPAGTWLNMLEDLEKEPGFRKSLVLKDRFEYADSLMHSEGNFWRTFIDKWGLLDIPPYAIGAYPTPDIQAANIAAKESRVAGYLEDFREEYATTDDQKAISRFKEDFDTKTAELDALAIEDKIPDFIENPPMTLDDQLTYEVLALPGDVPMVASTFENMTSSQIGLALNLNVLPENLLVYLPALPSVLTSIGVTRDGEVIPFEVMSERLRSEVMSLNAFYSSNGHTNRAELVVSGRASNLEELKNALGWMDAALYSPYLSVDNIPRMMDLIDQALVGYRNRTKGSEEDWVDNPVFGYRYQTNPVLMSTGCFLTELHHMQRLKWMLTDLGSGEQQQETVGALEALKQSASGLDREGLTAFLDGADYAELGEPLATVMTDVNDALKATLGDIPDETLSADFAFMCDEIKNDLLVKPESALTDINTALDLLRKSDNARMYMISNSDDRNASMELIREFVGKLDSRTKSVDQQYAKSNRIAQRLIDRTPGLDTKPVYVGLLHEETRNGVLLFGAKETEVRYDTSTSQVLTCLAGKLYGGGGPHGLFMRTWAAGLAYSNGYGYRENAGRVSYYAERCPDVAETMRFVVNELKTAKDDPSLTSYAVAQVFGASRSASRYETRGAAMASDLADGQSPEMVRAFREKVLAIRDDEGLYDDVKSRMEEAYGPVMIGYGAPLAESKDSYFFLIGPDEQFESLENYIATVEQPQAVYRLYPRDYWLVD